MKNYNRDLLVLYKAETFNEDLLEQQLECLHKILGNVETNAMFCTAHELATRTKITSKPKAILKATAETELRPFYFLINKN